MIQSRDELIMEMAEEYGLNHMGENNDDDDEDDNDEGNIIAPPTPTLLPCLRRSSKKKPPWIMVHRSWMIWMTWMMWMMIQMNATLTWMSGFPKRGVMIEIE
jgi:phage portal protein BeeE